MTPFKTAALDAALLGSILNVVENKAPESAAPAPEVEKQEPVNENADEFKHPNADNSGSARADDHVGSHTHEDGSTTHVFHHSPGMGDWRARGTHVEPNGQKHHFEEGPDGKLGSHHSEDIAKKIKKGINRAFDKKVNESEDLEPNDHDHNGAAHLHAANAIGAALALLGDHVGMTHPHHSAVINGLKAMHADSLAQSKACIGKSVWGAAGHADVANDLKSDIVRTVNKSLYGNHSGQLHEMVDHGQETLADHRDENGKEHNLHGPAVSIARHYGDDEHHATQTETTHYYYKNGKHIASKVDVNRKDGESYSHYLSDEHRWSTDQAMFRNSLAHHGIKE